ncbi:hypothetical protein OKB57_25270 (plasmid) [Serratia marcescens]|uniref:hypothetical protein n=1 Tax=Serratia marcescens TaxID=615 RepID=UPI002224A407|nr:hypothetical protein [Serratia marcescens]UYY70145.1 hypothetical protein OKB57_25270 [Serratia marcescens]
MLQAQAAVGASMQMATAGQSGLINSAKSFGQTLGDRLKPKPNNTQLMEIMVKVQVKVKKNQYHQIINLKIPV